MRKDRKRPRTRTSSLASRRGQGDASQRLNQIRSMGQAVLRHTPPDEAQEIQHLLDMADQVAAYDAMRGETEAAAKALEAHRPQE